MKDAAIVTIGSELVSGQRFDTNGPAIAAKLTAAGYRIRALVSVGDDIDLLRSAYTAYVSSFDLVVSTGGLGPTHDDVTREAAADALGKSLVSDPRLKAKLEPLAARYSEDVYRQALVIEGATPLDAITGSAPGQLVPTPKGLLLLLPGPPNECMPLLDVFLEMESARALQSIDFSTFGLDESEVQHQVLPYVEGTDDIGFTVLASPSCVHVILNDEGCGPSKLSSVGTDVRGKLAPYIFSETGQPLSEVVLSLARERGLKLATAESCTGGLVSSALTDIPGSSDTFLGSIVSYANEVKMGQLGVSGETLDTYGAVSEQTARSMAEGVCEQLEATLAVSITGIAGPGGGTADKPVGTVWFAVCGPDGCEAVLKHMVGSRNNIREHSAAMALDLLRRSMLGMPLNIEHASKH